MSDKISFGKLMENIENHNVDNIYFTDDLKKIYTKYTNEDDDHPRMIIPFFKPSGKCFAYQGRAYGNEEPKYYTIKIDETEEKIYGLDRVDFSKRIYVVEGPIDSLFLPNAIAVSGASFDTPTIRQLLTNATIIMDNEPRNKEIVKQLAKYIDLGYNVCMFPDTMQEKDINDMVVSGKSVDEILNIINTNTTSGMEAKLKFADWRKD
jgi:DNA primase